MRRHPQKLLPRSPGEKEARQVRFSIYEPGFSNKPGNTKAQLWPDLRLEREQPGVDASLPHLIYDVEKLKAAITKRGLKIPDGAKKVDLEKLYSGPDGRPE